MLYMFLIPLYLYFPDTPRIMPFPVATRSKEWDCRRSFDGTVVSNRSGSMDVCPLWVLRVVR